jgi:1-phosphofructokinase family hexose kinase
MIVTVTANTTLDQTLFVSAFQKNRTMRATDTVQSMGGKPTDASWILGELGVGSLALGFAAGTTGDRVESMLRARGVTTNFIRVNGESRLNVVIIDHSDNSHSTITTNTLRVDESHISTLHSQYIQALDEASCVILGGTLPTGVQPSFYADLISLARQRNVPTIFDAAEPNLSAGLAASPTFVKPNRDELAGLVGYPIDSIDDAYRAGRCIQDRYGTSPIVTLGADGALAILPDRVYRIPPLKVDVVSAAGAGDAVLAGLAASIHRKEPIEEGLRLGFGAATAVTLLPGTADCRRDDVERLSDQIELLPIAITNNTT